MPTEVERIKQMASCALAAYEPGTYEIQKMLTEQSEGFVDVKPVFHKNGQAIVAEYDKFRVVAIRGTDEGRDWINNLTLGTGPLHFWMAGFHHHAGLLHHPILDTLAGMVRESGRKPVHFTGHSLGSTAALILGLEYAFAGRGYEEQYGLTAGIYTFGSPRAATKVAVKEYGNVSAFPIVRVRHANDIVPRLPKGYHHLGELVYLDHRDRVCLGSTFCYRLQDRLADFSLSKLVTDHDMFKYDRAIRKWEVKQ